MSLQRRLMLWLLVLAPLVWGLGALATFMGARREIDELFDTQLIQLARQMQSTLPTATLDVIERPAERFQADGSAELDDLSIAVWNHEGRLLLVDREGTQLPWVADASGFRDLVLLGNAWRVYYLQSASGKWLVAVGQSAHERDELVRDVVAGQLVPWLLTLPVLLLVMAGAVRSALGPLRAMSTDLAQRSADDLRPLPHAELPAELQPLARAMNALFGRIGSTIEHERRFTADAAHELRTPLAAVRAQWEASRGAHADAAADARVGEGLLRLERLIGQMLALARLEPARELASRAPLNWSAIAESVLSDLWPLAQQQQVEPAVEGLDAAPRWQGDEALMGVLLRNLLDNAIRHSPRGAVVTLRLSPTQLEVLDEGPGVKPEHLPRLGDRFFRPAGEVQPGSGLGLSIAVRIAELHGLRLDWHNRGTGGGLCVRLTPEPPPAAQ